MNTETQKYFILVFIAVLIIALIILFFLRYTVFKTGKYLTTLPESELIAQGYGVYSSAFSTGCLTASGKCTTSGLKYTTQYCVPNKKTGKGCLNQDGELTFGSQTIAENCLPSCRAYTLNQINPEDNTNPSPNDYRFCNYPAPYNDPSYPCVPSNVLPYKYNILNCQINDGVGVNSCTYVCGQDGIGPNGITGDSDNTLPSYIPNCVGQKGNIITLNSFNYNLVGNIPGNGFKISKGYTISNFTATGASGPSLNEFLIDPPYLPAPTDGNLNPASSGLITIEQLRLLDNQFVILENCSVNPRKNTCNSLYTYTPAKIGSNTTYADRKMVPLTSGNIVKTPDCYVDPFWNNGDYINPFTRKINNVNFYNAGEGIGQFGITFEYESCESSKSVLSKVPGTNPQQYYLPPPYTTSSTCLPLSPTGAGAPPSNKTCYVDKNDIPITFTQGKNYSICDTVFPDGTRPLGYNGSTPIPGLTTLCQYMPDNNIIDFAAAYPSTIDPMITKLIGNYIQIKITDPGNKSYFLGLSTTPCATGTINPLLAPLTNCRTISTDFSNGYVIQNCLFVYDGGNEGSGPEGAGIFWDKLNCDDEMISLTSSLSIIVSPVADFGTDYVDCYLFGYFGNTYGQLSTVNSYLNFQPLTNSQTFVKTNYTGSLFRIVYNTTTNNYEIYENFGGTLHSVFVNYFDGKTYSSTNVVSISDSSVKVIPRTLPFNGPVIKEGGINAGSNITTVLQQQRNNAGYYNNCNPDVILQDVPCFPSTCNLYYK